MVLVVENRFKEARTKHNQHGQQSVKEVAQMTGISGSLIDDLESNVGKPRDVGYSKIRKLAEYYGVSSDFLLQLSATPSVKEDIQVVCKTTGLTEKAIESIKASGGWGMDVLNSLLEDSAFFNLLLDIRRVAAEERRLKVAEASLVETADDRYATNVVRHTEKRDVRFYWAVKNFETLLSATVDEIISHKEFQKSVDMVDRAVKKEFNGQEAENHGKH